MNKTLHAEAVYADFFLNSNIRCSVLMVNSESKLEGNPCNSCVFFTRIKKKKNVLTIISDAIC